VLSLCLTFFLWSQYFQIMASTYLMVMMVIYVGQARPYKRRSDNKMDMFNEIFVAMLCYCLICFADLVRDPAVLSMIGWVMIAIIVINMLVNFPLIFFKAVKKLYVNLRLKYARRRMK
jgi:hypothetical protein